MATSSNRTMTLCYVAAILKEPADTNYFAVVPDLGVCFGIGETIAEAKASLSDGLILHVDGIRSSGTPMPTPRGRDEVLSSISDHIVEDYVVEIEIDLRPRPLLHPGVQTPGRMS